MKEESSSASVFDAVVGETQRYLNEASDEVLATSGYARRIIGEVNDLRGELQLLGRPDAADIWAEWTEKKSHHPDVLWTISMCGQCQDGLVVTPMASSSPTTSDHFWNCKTCRDNPRSDSEWEEMDKEQSGEWQASRKRRAGIMPNQEED